MIEEYIISKCLDRVLSRLNNIVGTDKSRYIITKSNIEEAIVFHSKQIENWSSEIGFKDLENPKSLLKTYINLDLFLTPRRQIITEGVEKKTKVNTLIKKDNRNLIILGQPGAGKTTSVKHICQTLLHKDNAYPNFNIPIVIRLRELINSNNREGDTILEKLFEILGLIVIIEKKNKKKNGDYETNKIEIRKDSVNKHKDKILKIVSELLDELGVLLILDGLDEVPEKIRNQILTDIRQLSISLTKSRFILTSRLGEFHYSIENASEYELCPLNDKQIEQFTRKWIRNNSDDKEFISQLNESPFKDTAMRPLTLAHLLAIYEREKQIPDKPKTVYRKIINLLLDEWDLQRSIKRKSSYGNFEVDRKLEFLAHMSYYLTLTYNKTIFTKNEFEIAYKEICENFNLPKYESKKVANELETHNGLFMQTGYESYEFAHKSMQEYLTADHLVKLPYIPVDRQMLTIPNEIALCIAISSNPTTYFVTLVFHILKTFDIPLDFIKIFFDRILVEKVDFNQHPMLALSFLYLFTNQLNKTSKKVQTISTIFQKLYSMDAFKSALQKLNEYYEVLENTNGYDNIITIKFKKHIKNEIIAKLPELLYAHESFLYNWE